MEDGVTERAPRPEIAARGTTEDGSRSSASRLAGFRSAIGRAGPGFLAVTVAGLAAGLLMVVAEFSTIASVDVASGSCAVINDSDPSLADRCELSGLERHGGALILLGLVTGFMAVGAGIGRSRPAAAALILIGIVVIGITMLLDVPEADETGAIGRNFEGAKGSAATGLYLEAIAGLLAIGAGALRLMQREPERERPGERPERS
jgi:hypothetical protein